MLYTYFIHFNLKNSLHIFKSLHLQSISQYIKKLQIKMDIIKRMEYRIIKRKSLYYTPKGLKNLVRQKKQNLSP